MLFATDVKDFTCICCPFGCQLEVSFDDDGNVAEITGFACNRGETYARQEATNPVRMVTAVVCVQGSLEPMSVKTAEPIPKEKIADVLAEVRTLRLQVPIEAGTVLIDDVAGTGVSVIATKGLE